MGDVISWILLSLGGFVSLSGALGVLRFPDFYSRLHPAGASDTLAQLLIMLGLIPQLSGNWVDAAKLLFISLLLFVTTPTSTHAISQAARLDGLTPWRKEEKEKAHG